jgi:hypothetical protein
VNNPTATGTLTTPSLSVTGTSTFTGNSTMHGQLAVHSVAVTTTLSAGDSTLSSITIPRNTLLTSDLNLFIGTPSSKIDGTTVLTMGTSTYQPFNMVLQNDLSSAYLQFNGISRASQLEIFNPMQPSNPSIYFGRLGVVSETSIGIAIGTINSQGSGYQPFQMQVNKSNGITNFSLNGDTTIFGNSYANNLSTTVTHITNIEDPEPMFFCETNGGLYTGYEKIGVTDCICQVKKSTELSSKIMGIMTSEENFASHGNVLVKVIDGVYQLGDLLVPCEGGARVATQEEKVTIMLNGIPRVKITSLATEIPNVVACFIC